LWLLTLAMKKLTTLEDIQSAAGRIRNVAVRTPVLDVSHATSDLPHPHPRLHLKCEMLQAIGAFKIRGAYNMIAQMSPEERRRGLLASSSGNHGQATAMAAAAFNVPALIVMPTNAPAAKINGVLRYGAEIVYEGTTSAERRLRGEAIAHAHGMTLIPPFDLRAQCLDGTRERTGLRVVARNHTTAVNDGLLC